MPEARATPVTTPTGWRMRTHISKVGIAGSNEAEAELHDNLAGFGVSVTKAGGHADPAGLGAGGPGQADRGTGGGWRGHCGHGGHGAPH